MSSNSNREQRIQFTPFPMMKFEYSTLVFDTTAFFTGSKLNHERFHEKLNEYGRDGWELVNALDLNRVHGETYEVIAIFKRPLGN